MCHAFSTAIQTGNHSNASFVPGAWTGIGPKIYTVRNHSDRGVPSTSDGFQRIYEQAAEMDDRLATIGMGRKWGGAAVGAGSLLGPHLTQCGLGRGLPLYQVAS